MPIYLGGVFVPEEFIYSCACLVFGSPSRVKTGNIMLDLAFLTLLFLSVIRRRLPLVEVGLLFVFYFLKIELMRQHQKSMMTTRLISRCDICTMLLKIGDRS